MEHTRSEKFHDSVDVFSLNTIDNVIAHTGHQVTVSLDFNFRLEKLSSDLLVVLYILETLHYC